MKSLKKELLTFQGKLSVAARGYWFTAGGEKGAFGYYPHLRDADNLPLYPDTQIHGDLKMAARWLTGLGVANPNLVSDIFGGGGDSGARPKPSRVFIGDLTLAEESRNKWSPARFEVKSRIQINDETRSVDKHFLVDLEMARLDDIILESPIFLTVPEEQLVAAIQLIQEAAFLLSGFGGFRSRGYGRGSIAVDEFIPWQAQRDSAEACEITSRKRYRYALTALVNFRNKQVDPGSAQVISTALSISAEQLKGWLARVYREACGRWPEPAQMDTLQLSPLYPSPASDILAWPAPATTLMDKDGKIKDQWNSEKSEQHENFFSGKVKPLGANYMVTEGGTAWPVTIGSRMRNNTTDAFTATKNGLFVQEYLPAGTVFTGTVSLGTDEQFNKQITRLLIEKPPCLKGALFAPSLGSECLLYGVAGGNPQLLDRPLPFLPGKIDSRNCIAISSFRGYNTALEYPRPRRSRVIVQPGAILADGIAGDAAWPGFNSVLAGGDDCGKEQRQHKQRPAPRILLNAAQKKISRAQAGLLRMLMHPGLSRETVAKHLLDRIDKYARKNRQPELRQLLQEILGVLIAHENGGMDAMRYAVKEVVEQLALARWETKNNHKRPAEGL